MDEIEGNVEFVAEYSRIGQEYYGKEIYPSGMGYTWYVGIKAIVAAARQAENLDPEGMTKALSAVHFATKYGDDLYFRDFDHVMAHAYYYVTAVEDTTGKWEIPVGEIYAVYTGDEMLPSKEDMQAYAAEIGYTCLGISGGCCVLSAQFWGAGDGARVRQVWRLAMLLAGGAAVIFSAVTALLPAQIMRVYTTDSQMIELGARYLRVTAGVFFFHGTSLVMVNLLRTVGLNYVGLLVSSVSFVVNILLNYMFIFGKFGAPRLGIAGAALGTLLSRVAEFAITFTVLLRRNRVLPFRLYDFTGRLEKSLLHRFAAVGLPPIISDSLFTLGDNVLCVILGHMSAAVVSGQAITLATMRFCTAFIMGLSNAASVCVGHAVGRGEREAVQRQGKTFYLLSVAGGLIGGVIIWAVSPFIVGCYQLSEQATDATMQMMLAMSLLMVFQAAQSVMSKGVLRGGGDTRFLMFADLVFIWGLNVPLGYLAGLCWGWTPFWVFVCLKLDAVVKTFVLLARLLSGKWIRNVNAA